MVDISAIGLIVQLVNTLFVFAFIYLVYYLVIKLPRTMDLTNRRLSKVEKDIDELKDKYDNS